MSTKRFPHAALGLLSGGLLLTACADQGAPSAANFGQTAAAHAPRSSCFWPSEVSSWRAAGNQTVYVRVSINRVFRMRLMGPCPDINWSERIGIERRGSPQICEAMDATIIAPSSIGPRRCPVTALHELTTAEIAALPPRHRP